MSASVEPSSPHVNATVMASAGTGKTWLLVSRLLRLLLHGVQADTILAITFTRKAAAEMQTRLSERLFALASADDDHLRTLLHELSLPADTPTIARARALYETLLQTGRRVRTTTFHAFCQDILRRFPLEADVPPGFELLESSTELIAAAWDTLMDEATNNPDGDLAQGLEQLLDYCGSLHGLREAVSAFISHRGDWWAYTEGQARPVAFATTQLRQQLQLPEGTSPLQRFFQPHTDEILTSYAALLAKHQTAGNLGRLALLAEARNPELPLAQRFASCREAFLTQKDEPRACKASKSQAKSMGEAGQERYIALHAELCTALRQTLDHLLGEEWLQAGEAWYGIGAALLASFQRIKEERRQLDFTDLEWRAYRLLYRSENVHWVQYKLDQRIEHLLVDEFQDTNPTQWQLLQPLLQEMASAEQERLRSVFLVGDAKQSIYRFRRAEPRLFQAAHEWLEQHLDARSYPLHTSWRSASAIMQAVNKVFGENAPLQGLLRDFTPHDTHHRNLWGSVNLLPLVEEPKAAAEANPPEVTEGLRNPLHQPRIIEGVQRYRLEGEQIAGEIQRLVEGKTPVGADGEARPMRYGDVMILVRKRSHVGAYEQALREAGIPYLGAERGTLLDSLEVRDMVALLEVLHTPYNNLSLAHVLRSPLFACDDKALMALAAMDKGSGHWFQRLAACAGSNSDSSLQRAWRLLSRWREAVGILPIHDLLDRIFSEGNVLARYRAAYPAHLQDRSESNLTRFLELALAIDSGRYPSLGHFLSRLAGMRENSDEAPDEAPAGGSGDRVRIMTIHAAKGLEAPVVFLADSAGSGNRERPFRALVEWPVEASRPSAFMLIGKKGQQPSILRDAMAREQQEALREDGNLLYVALTRARQHLYLSASAPGRGEELGWYGALRQALAPDRTTAQDEIYRFESGAPPVLSQEIEAVTVASASAVPAALSQPLTLAPAAREIAPSYRAGWEASLGGGDEDGRLRGIAIHRLLELLCHEEAAATEEVATRVAGELGIAAQDREYLDWLNEVRRLLADPALAAILRPETGVRALNEVPLVYTYQGQTVHGIIDRLLLSQQEAWVVDYKTHRRARHDNLARMAEPYRQQLRYYAEGINRLWPGLRVRTFLLFTTCAALYELPA